MFKKMKVFDCQDMPKDIRTHFFNNYGTARSNDSYVKVWIEGDCNSEECDKDYECKTCDLREYDIVEKWLIDNGADDEVLVKRWW